MKKVLCLLLMLCLTLSFAGFAEAEDTLYPLEITDQAGRTIVLEKEPERIVSGYYISTSALIALGLKDRLVGIEAKANKRAIYKLSAPELIDLPSVGTAKEFDLEGCAALAPDLIVLPVKLKNAAETLTELGFSVLLVNPESQDQLMEMLEMLACACNAGEKEEALVRFITTQEEKLAEITGEKPAVYLASNSALLSTAGEAMYQSYMIEMAGGANVAAEITDTYWAEISYEQLLAWDPAYIVLASDASYTVEDVLEDPNLADCTAIKQAQVIHLPDTAEAWDSPLPSGILGSLWLASTMHEDQLPWSYTNEAIRSFYLEFYGFEYEE